MTENENRMSRFVFCDFDGTITAKESLEAVFKQFTPDLFQPVKDKMMALDMSLREGVRQLLESIPSKHYPDILAYVQQIPIRPGFDALLDFLDEQGVPFVIVSGGLRGMVDARLGDIAGRVHKIFALDADTSGEYIQVRSDFEGGMELMAKVDVMNLFDAKESVIIGDGVTDINMARQGSIVFARDSLAFFLKHMGVAYRQWSDFFDIVNALKSVWKN